MKNWDPLELGPELAIDTTPENYCHCSNDYIRISGMATFQRKTCRLWAICTSHVVFQTVCNFVWKLSAPDGISSFAGSGWVACLNHETFDVSMEEGVLEKRTTELFSHFRHQKRAKRQNTHVVVVRRGQGKEVFAGFWSLVNRQFARKEHEMLSFKVLSFLIQKI